MGSLHATVSFPHKSGLVRDEVVNTFAFSKVGAWTTPDFASIEPALADFYTTTPAGAIRSVGNYMGNQLSRVTGATLRFFDITGHEDGTPAGSPVAINTLPVLGAMFGSLPLPGQVSAVLSFHGDYGADVEFAPGARPRSRDRGRIYLGPLSNATGAEDATTHDVFLDTQFKTDVLAAAKALRAALDPGIIWCAWSRKNARLSPITTWWFDNVMDTQRRREQRPTSKTTATFP